MIHILLDLAGDPSGALACVTRELSRACRELARAQGELTAYKCGGATVLVLNARGAVLVDILGEEAEARSALLGLRACAPMDRAYVRLIERLGG